MRSGLHRLPGNRGRRVILGAVAVVVFALSCRKTSCRPLHVPVRIEGILFDRATPWELKVLTVKRAL